MPPTEDKDAINLVLGGQTIRYNTSNDARCSNASGGCLWSDLSIWDRGVLPQDNDTVIISSSWSGGITIKIDNNASASYIYLQGSSTLLVMGDLYASVQTYNSSRLNITLGSLAGLKLVMFDTSQWYFQETLVYVEHFLGNSAVSYDSVIFLNSTLYAEQLFALQAGHIQDTHIECPMIQLGNVWLEGDIITNGVIFVSESAVYDNVVNYQAESIDTSRWDNASISFIESTFEVDLVILCSSCGLSVMSSNDSALNKVDNIAGSGDVTIIGTQIICNEAHFETLYVSGEISRATFSNGRASNIVQVDSSADSVFYLTVGNFQFSHSEMNLVMNVYILQALNLNSFSIVFPSGSSVAGPGYLNLKDTTASSEIPLTSLTTLQLSNATLYAPSVLCSQSIISTFVGMNTIGISGAPEQQQGGGNVSASFELHSNITIIGSVSISGLIFGLGMQTVLNVINGSVAVSGALIGYTPSFEWSPGESGSQLVLHVATASGDNSTTNNITTSYITGKFTSTNIVSSPTSQYSLSFSSNIVDDHSIFFRWVNSGNVPAPGNIPVWLIVLLCVFCGSVILLASFYVYKKIKRSKSYEKI
eukprot:TRINITY_DN3548_c0_g1_i2.p1 TRINITY_DN3548_c0_g1~~TRINITY_DN3548_c0_g1_i2.p1  ORF type:complete len:635 (+),score=107.67 TRINITY_DN3548_c0_g1_i2:138-1907(+)